MHIFFVLLFLLSSCASKPLKVATGLTEADFWEDQELRKSQFVRYDGKLKIRIEEKGRGVSGNARVLMGSADSIKMEVRDPFGRLHLAIGKKKTSFMAYEPQPKVVTYDEVGGRDYLFERLSVSLTFDEVLKLWTGSLPTQIKRAPFKSWDWDPKEGNYVGLLQTADMKILCHVDGDLGALKKLEWLKPGPSFTVEYEDLGSCCEDKKASDKLPLAYSAKFSMQSSSSKIELDWDQIERGAKMPQSLDVELPKDLQKIVLKSGK